MLVAAALRAIDLHLFGTFHRDQGYVGPLQRFSTSVAQKVLRTSSNDSPLFTILLEPPSWFSIYFNLNLNTVLFQLIFAFYFRLSRWQYTLIKYESIFTISFATILQLLNIPRIKLHTSPSSTHSNIQQNYSHIIEIRVTRRDSQSINVPGEIENFQHTKNSIVIFNYREIIILILSSLFKINQSAACHDASKPV